MLKRKKQVSKFTTMRVKKARRNQIRRLAEKHGLSIEEVADIVLSSGLVEVNKLATVTKDGGISDTEEVGIEPNKVELENVNHFSLSNVQGKLKSNNQENILQS